MKKVFAALAALAMMAAVVSCEYDSPEHQVSADHNNHE